MAISEIHALGSCKAVPAASRCYSHNRNRAQSPLTLGSAHASPLPSLPSLLFMSLAALLMLTSCLALPSETTTALPSVDIEEATTEISPQQLAIESNSPQSLSTVAVNETFVQIEPIKSAAAEIVDEVVHTGFVSLGGEGLEQGIRNAVKTEIELEIEADSSGPLVDTLQAEHVDNEQKTTNSHVEQTDAAQGVREPKALDAEAVADEMDVKSTHAVVDNDKLPVEAEAEAVAEDHTKQPAEAVVNNEKSIVETEPEEKSKEPTDAIDQVVESEPETVTQNAPTTSERVEQENHNPALPSVTSDLVAVIFDENRAITEQPITNTNRLALEHEHEKIPLTEETPKPSYEETKHQVTKKQGVEDLQPLEVPKENAEKQDEPEPAMVTEQAPQPKDIEYAPKVTTEPSTLLNEIEENIIESDANEKEVQQVASSSTEPEHIESTEASVSVVAPVNEEVVEPYDIDNLTPAEGTLTPSISQEAGAEEAKAEAEPKPVHEVSIAAEGEENTPESSSTVASAEPDQSEVDSDESEQQTKQPDSESIEKESSEESDELSADEPKAKAEDSTATPLVSYPPHNSGQTFDSNLADERSAYLSLASSSRSTLIIALCSGTAVIFIVISLVIFVLSFQRQHGTLDIEMQEQRLGKDNLDEEDAQMKLLDVDLSPPVIIAMGNEETDECL